MISTLKAKYQTLEDKITEALLGIAEQTRKVPI